MSSQQVQVYVKNAPDPVEAWIPAGVPDLAAGQTLTLSVPDLSRAVVYIPAGEIRLIKVVEPSP